MDRELIEHAARVLRTAPGRTMEARALYERVSRETGIRCGTSLLLQRLSDRPDRFSMLEAPAGVHDGGAWTEGERRSYAGLLPAAAQTGQSLVALCELERDPGVAPDADTDVDGLTAVHQSVAELLRCAGADAHLRAAVGSAVAALGAATAPAAVSRVNRPVRAAARSTTAPRRPRPRR